MQAVATQLKEKASTEAPGSDVQADAPSRRGDVLADPLVDPLKKVQPSGDAALDQVTTGDATAKDSSASSPERERSAVDRKAYVNGGLWIFDQPTDTYANPLTTLPDRTTLQLSQAHAVAKKTTFYEATVLASSDAAWTGRKGWVPNNGSRLVMGSPPADTKKEEAKEESKPSLPPGTWTDLATSQKKKFTPQKGKSVEVPAGTKLKVNTDQASFGKDGVLFVSWKTTPVLMGMEAASQLLGKEPAAAAIGASEYGRLLGDMPVDAFPAGFDPANAQKKKTPTKKLKGLDAVLARDPFKFPSENARSGASGRSPVSWPPLRQAPCLRNRGISARTSTAFGPG